MLELVTPPSADVPAPAAQFLAVDEGASRSWPTAAKVLLRARHHRREFCKAWRAVLLRPLASSTRRRVLSLLPEAILPHVPRPLRYCDFLSDSFAGGGVEALLALKGLFMLMQRHNLEYPSFYARLYALLSVAARCGPHRALFARELELFLSSSALPAYLLAAFAKVPRRTLLARAHTHAHLSRARYADPRRRQLRRARCAWQRMGRIALVATPVGAAVAVALIFNLLLNHSAVRSLVHRPSSQATATADPFVEAEDDPASCNALDSSLWEVSTLSSHYSPTVASLANLFATPYASNTPPLDVQTFAALSAKAFIRLEAGKRLRAVPTSKEPPRALFKDGIFAS